MEKAQVGFIVLIGIFVVVAVAVTLAYQQSVPTTAPVPSGVAQEYESVKASVKGMVSTGGNDIIRTVESHGGYLTGDLINGSYDIAPYTIFLGQGVPYWQICQNDVSPDKGIAKAAMEDALETYIREHMESIQKLYGRVYFDLSRLKVDANVFENRIDFTLNLPTSIQNYSIQEPYEVSIPTNFGRIYDFADDFIRESTKPPESGGRFLEVFTIQSLYESRHLPTIGALGHCGEMIFLMPDEIEEHLKDLAGYNLAVLNNHMWEKMPDSRTYAVESVNGKKYQDLNVEFLLPDDFSFNVLRPILLTNNERLSTRWPFIVPDCLSLHYQGYSLAYPVVISITDRITGERFNFAVLVYVNQDERDVMQPGECIADASNIATAGEGEEGVCDVLRCHARIEIRNTTGPLEGVSAMFGGCPIEGESDSNGILEGRIKCGVYNISIGQTGYLYYTEGLPSYEINKSYTLYRIPENTTLNFYSVDIKTGKATAQTIILIQTPIYHICTVSPVTSEWLILDFSSWPVTNFDVSEECSYENQDACYDTVIVPSKTVSYLPEGLHDVDAELRDPSNDYRVSGAFRTEYYLSGEDEKTYYIHVPGGVSGGELSNEEKVQQTGDMESKCGIKPVSESLNRSVINMIDCSCSNLKIAIDNELSGCQAYSEMSGKFCTGPEGSALGYPGSCGSCGGLENDCKWYCDRDSVVSLAEQSCGVEVIGCV